MQHAELDALLRSDETDRVEKTVSGTDTDKWAKAVCAFANDLPGRRQPGYLFIGARPDGSASGLPITDELLQKLGGLRSDGNIQPIPSLTVERVETGGGQMAVVEVQPSDLPPVRYKGRVYVRIGPREGIASEQEERILAERRAHLARTWDAWPCREASLDDLVLDLFALSYRAFAVDREVIEENHRSLEAQLAALRFYDLRAGCPTNAGVLLFAREPRSFVAGAYVQIVWYDGLDQAADVLKDRRVEGDFLSVLRELRLLSQELAGARPAPLEEGGRELYDYPPAVLHELFMNAVTHRSYQATAPVMVNVFHDRIEILSPGGLFDLLPEEFPNGTGYRNPVLAEAARVLGFVNRYGRGIIRAQSLLTKNGSPPAVFNVRLNHVLVVLGRRP